MLDWFERVPKGINTGMASQPKGLLENTHIEGKTQLTITTRIQIQNTIITVIIPIITSIMKTLTILGKVSKMLNASLTLLCYIEAKRLKARI